IIYGHLGQDEALIAYSEQYVQIAAWMIFPALGMMVVRSLLSVFDATRVILVVTAAGVVVNVFLSYGLTFGHFGMPRLELRRAGHPHHQYPDVRRAARLCAAPAPVPALPHPRSLLEARLAAFSRDHPHRPAHRPHRARRSGAVHRRGPLDGAARHRRSGGAR